MSNVAGPNWVLVGDAAACVNPLNGEGIDYGLETGRLVAELLADAATTCRRAWPALLREHYGESFSIARRLAGLVTVPRLLPTLGPAGMRSDWLMTLALRWMGNLVTDEDRDRAARVWRWAGSPVAGPRPPSAVRLTAVGRGTVSSLPRQQRVAAYAVILRDEQILLCRLAPRISAEELWTLPGGGVDHGEHPRDAVVREIARRPGWTREVGDAARVYSAHLPGVWRGGARVDAHALRIVYDGWVATDAPAAAGSSRWTARRSRRPGCRCADVLDGTVPGGRRWSARRWPTTGRSSCSASRRTP